MRPYSTFRAATLCLIGLLLAFCTGCPVVSNLPAPGTVQTLRDPEWGRQYRLYVPSHYKDDRKWPLVVACHGAKPFDSPSTQMTEWKGLGELRGFLVAVPDLTAPASLLPKPDVQLERQQDDDRAILGIIKAIRAARSVDDTRVFMVGWAAGNYVTLYSGLRHPEIFRALSCRQGAFRTEFIDPVIPFMDHNQPIQVSYGELDVTKPEAEKCIDWLRAHDLDPTPLKSNGGHNRDPEPTFSFFSWVVRNRPWVRVEVGEDPSDDMRVTLRVKATFEPTRYLWNFGDGTSSTDPAPSHQYEKPGQYTVQLALGGGGQKKLVRHIELQMPRTRLGGKPKAETAK